MKRTQTACLHPPAPPMLTPMPSLSYRRSISNVSVSPGRDLGGLYLATLVLALPGTDDQIVLRRESSPARAALAAWGAATEAVLAYYGQIASSLRLLASGDYRLTEGSRGPLVTMLRVTGQTC